MADWLTIKTEYVTSGITLEELSRKYGVPHSTAMKRCARERWAEQRKKHWHDVGILAEEKAAEKIADIESEIAAVKARTRLALWEEIGRRMQRGAAELEGADLRRMVQNYCDLIGAEPDRNGGGDIEDLSLLADKLKR